MAKGVCLGPPLHGHTNPSLPLVRALVDRGGEVAYFSSDAFADKIEQAGARYSRYRSAFLADAAQIVDRTDKMSLGTLFNADPTFYRHCFEAFGDQNLRVVMSIGTAITEASLGSPPANIVVKPWVAQLEVLRRASVFVSHGGMNSVSRSRVLRGRRRCRPRRRCDPGLHEAPP